MALSGLGWENITSVILMGGHSRVPMIQAAIRELSGECVLLIVSLPFVH